MQSPLPSNPTAFKRLVDKIQGLPTLPSVVVKLLALAENPVTSAKDIETVLAGDPPLTMKVMSVANSSFYGYHNNVRTLTEAIIILGFPTIRSIVLAASVFQAFPGTARPGFDRAQFWRHSLATAVASRLLAIQKQTIDMEEAFIAGLIHDIGKIVLDEYASDQWQSALTYSSEKKVMLVEAELALFGFSHAQVGQWLAIKWKLPTPYASAIFYHHQPAFARHDEVLVSIVHIADSLVRESHLGSGGDDVVPPIDPEALRQTGFTEETLKKVRDKLPDAFEKASASFPLPGR